MSVPIRNSEPPGPTEALVPQLKLRRRGSKLEDGARGARGVLVEQQQVGLREPGRGAGQRGVSRQRGTEVARAGLGISEPERSPSALHCAPGAALA